MVFQKSDLESPPKKGVFWGVFTQIRASRACGMIREPAERIPDRLPAIESWSKDGIPASLSLVATSYLMAYGHDSYSPTVKGELSVGIDDFPALC